MSGFVMVPAWLRRRRPSGNALIAYVTLASFGTFNPETGTYDECRPSLATMEEESGLSERTLQRGITELIGYGAVERTIVVDPIKGRQPSVYRVIFGHLEGPKQTTAEEIDTAVVGVAPPVSDGLTSETATGVAREVSPVAVGRRQESHGGGVTGGVEPITPTTDNQDTKKNTTTRERVDADERDPLTSPGFLIDTPAAGGVLSRHTPSSGDLARRHYAETKKITEDIMISYATWFARETGEDLSPTEQRKIAVVVSGLVNERRPDDDPKRLRNSIASGLGNWTRSNSFSAKQIPDFVLLAKRAVVAEAPKSKIAEKQRRTAETFAWAAGKTPEQMAASLAEQLQATRPASFGPAPSIARVTAAIEGGWTE